MTSGFSALAWTISSEVDQYIESHFCTSPAMSQATSHYMEWRITKLVLNHIDGSYGGGVYTWEALCSQVHQLIHNDLALSVTVPFSIGLKNRSLCIMCLWGKFCFFHIEAPGSLTSRRSNAPCTNLEASCLRTVIVVPVPMLAARSQNLSPGRTWMNRLVMALWQWTSTPSSGLLKHHWFKRAFTVESIKKSSEIVNLHPFN